MPWMYWGDDKGPAEIFDFRFQRIMRCLKATPVKRYLLALGRHGADNPYTEQLRQEALASARQQLAEVERQLLELECEYPELASREDEHDDDD